MKKFLGIVVVLVLGYFGWNHLTNKSSENKYSALNNTKPVVDGSYYKSQVQQIRRFCPEARLLAKNGNSWSSKDLEWVSYTPSTASKVLEFVGTQWSGKAGRGQVTCMYRTDENVAFTLNLEPKNAMVVVEPANQAGWSARINNSYRLCRSVNPADCSFIQERPITKSQQDIFDDIKWQEDQGNK